MNGNTKNKKRLLLVLLIIFLVNILLILTAQSVKAASYKRGSTGTAVKQIQQKLSDWGYYSDGIDGVFGSRTETAVRSFQQKNGLTADGVAGPATLAAMGISSSSSGSTSYSNDVNLLARVISAEARGEPFEGQVAVGAVILNRTKHPSFPKTISGVVYQPGAFTCLSDGQFYTSVASSAYTAAQDAINGWDPTGGAIYYYNPSTATSAWIWSRPILIKIGNHCFCS